MRLRLRGSPILIDQPDIRTTCNRSLLLLCIVQCSGFRGSPITSDAGLLAFRAGRHPVLLRQSVFGRVAGYEDGNGIDPLCYEPVMRWEVTDRAITGSAARPAACPKIAEPWSLTSLRENLIKNGAKVVSHGRSVAFQMAEVAVRW
jgi:hypothetical protein